VEPEVIQITLELIKLSFVLEIPFFKSN